MIYLARYLGIEGFGIISLALAFTGIFAVFADFGLSTLMVREVSKDNSLDDKYLANLTAMKLILSIIIILLIIFLINFLKYPTNVINVIYIFALIILSNTLIQNFYSLFQAHEKMEYRSLGIILNSVIQFVSVFMGIYLKFDVIGFAFLYFLSSLIVLIYVIIVSIWKFIKPRIEFDLEFWKMVIVNAWPLGGMSIFIIIYFKIDTVMLSLIVGESAVGIYNAAYRFLEVSIVVPTIFLTAMFPIMSRFFIDSKNSFLAIYEKSTKYMLYISLIMALLVTILAGDIINLTFGSEFHGSIIALQILIWAAAIMYITTVQGNTLITANKQLFSFKVTILAAILNVLLNIILIPLYSYIGASIATVLTELFGFFIGIVYLNKWGYKINQKNVFLPPFCGILAAGFSSIILNILHVNVILLCIIVVIIYGLIVYKLGIAEEDKYIIRSLLNINK